MTWTDERVADLKRLHGEGLSSGQIAAVFGVSRNVIIGKAHRLGLVRDEAAAEAIRMATNKARQVPGSPTRIRKERAAARAAALPRPKPLKVVHVVPRLAPAPPKPAQPLRITIDDLRAGDCRYALWGHVRPPLAMQFYCGAPALEGTSWCRECAARVFRAYEGIAA